MGSMEPLPDLYKILGQIIKIEFLRGFRVIIMTTANSNDGYWSLNPLPEKYRKKEFIGEKY